MTRRKSLLAKGYIPKELPPNFFTEEFAAFASGRGGRALLGAHTLQGGITECSAYELAAPGGGHRTLAIPHPVTFTRLVDLMAKHWRSLHGKSVSSPISRSSPVYVVDGRRSIIPKATYRAADQDRLMIRGGYRYLLKADIAQFYPTLYCHAIGWAIDKRLRLKSHWRNQQLLGKKIDQAVMDLQGKKSQGVPTGSDTSFMLAELVLSEVDKTLGLDSTRAMRWLDDYEIACATREDAERCLSVLRKALGTFGLRINPKKTEIVALPQAIAPSWQRGLRDAVAEMLNPRNPDLDRFFDHAFDVRARHPDAPVFNYAFGQLFRVWQPVPSVAVRTQGAMMQAILAEPGCAQKGVAVLTYWCMNGMRLDTTLLRRTALDAIAAHTNRGLSSDIAWLVFCCIQNSVSLGQPGADLLLDCEDDCLALQSIHLRDLRLLPARFFPRILRKYGRSPDLDGPHWLLLYEAYRRGAISVPTSGLAHPVFSAMLTSGVRFYRDVVPPFAALIHPGGAPEWMVKRWLTVNDVEDESGGRPAAADPTASPTGTPTATAIRSAAAAFTGSGTMPGGVGLALLRGEAAEDLTDDDDDGDEEDSDDLSGEEFYEDDLIDDGGGYS